MEPLRPEHQMSSVGIKAKPTGDLNIYAKEVWNEAIEAAASKCDMRSDSLAHEIRRLKK